MSGVRRGLATALALLGVLGAAPTAAQAPGVTDAEILLGGSNSFSGPLAFSGQQMTTYGVDLYLRVVNDAGGIHGRKVRTIYYDDGSKPQEALANTRKLVEQDRVFALIVPQGSRPVAATLDYVEAQRVPLLFPYQSLPITRGKRYVFQGMTVADRSSRMTVDYLAGQRRHRRFAAIYQDDEYGRAFLAALRKDLGRRGLGLLAATPVARGATDLRAQVAALRAAKPEVLLLVLVPWPAAQVLRERRKIGWEDVLMVSMGPLTDERNLALAGDAAEGVEGLSLWPDPATSTLAGVARYREHLARYFPKNEPNRYSLAGYFAGWLFTEAARRAGRPLTRDGLIAALESLRAFESGILPPLTMAPDHETQKQGFWVRVEKGRLTPVTGWLTSE